ncbi:MAG: hypothetical protein Q8882_08300 [Bacillota bacterium]|nr:hypothetical protein [Bacillota bacterium]
MGYAMYKGNKDIVIHIENNLIYPEPLPTPTSPDMVYWFIHYTKENNIPRWHLYYWNIPIAITHYVSSFYDRYYLGFTLFGDRQAIMNQKKIEYGVDKFRIEARVAFAENNYWETSKDYYEDQPMELVVEKSDIIAYPQLYCSFALKTEQGGSAIITTDPNITEKNRIRNIKSLSTDWERRNGLYVKQDSFKRVNL